MIFNEWSEIRHRAALPLGLCLLLCARLLAVTTRQKRTRRVHNMDADNVKTYYSVAADLLYFYCFLSPAITTTVIIIKNTYLFAAPIFDTRPRTVAVPRVRVGGSV